MFFYLIFLNIYYWEKLTFSKLFGKVNFSKENLNKCTSFEEQKGTRYIRKNLYFGIIIFSYILSTKSCLRFLLNCFLREIKGFYQSSLGNKVDFRDIMNVPHISWLKIKKTETMFCRWKSTDNNGINIFLSLENPCTFLLAKEKTWKCIFNTNSELSQNCFPKSKLCYSK